MKWEHARQSNNVEVDCLGLRAPLNTPEGKAALACQQEVTNLRQGMVEERTSRFPLASIFNPNAKTNAEKSFKDGLHGFLSKKEQETSIKPLFDRLTGKDPFKARLQEFKEYLEIPPLETGKHKHR